MRDRQTCIGCGKKSPETETNYTLISAQFGWRLTRYKDPNDGTIVIEWRCPTCWREYKKAKGADAVPPSGVLPEARSTLDPASSPRQPTRPPARPVTAAPPPASGSSASARPSVPRPTPTSRPPKAEAKADPKSDRSGR